MTFPSRWTQFAAYGKTRWTCLPSRSILYSSFACEHAIRAFLPMLLATAIPVCLAQSSAITRTSPFQHAQDLLQQGNMEEAKASVQAELQKSPFSVEGLNLLGIIEGDERHFPQAIAAFQKAIRVAPSSTKARNNLGNIYVEMKKIDLAEAQFREVLRLDPTDRDGNYNLGLLLVAKGAPTAAIPHFLRVRPQDLSTRVNLIHALFQAKRPTEALRRVEELSTENENNLQVHFSLGVMLAAEKQYAAAKRELKMADALSPETFEILYNLGQVLLRNKESADADLVMGRALRLKPDSADALYLKAQACIDQSRPLDALDLLIRAHRIDKNNIDVIFLMARVSMAQNYFEDAIPLLESGLAIAPQRADLVASLGESYFMAGKVDKAIEQFNKLVKLEGSARSYAFLGLCYRNLGRFDEAKKNFQMGLRLDPHNASCIFNLGFIAERQGDSSHAEVLFLRALKTNPNFPDALLELANLRSAAGKYPEAADLLKRFVQVSHDPAPGYYKLAMIERALHDTASADRDLNVFKTLSKDASSGPYPFQHLFDYLDTRSTLAPGARNQLDLEDLTEEAKKHPDQPQNLYLLIEAYLRLGKIEEARSTVAQLDSLSAGDFRTLTGVGVLLARYHLYDEAIQHLQQALSINPTADDVHFDLANVYFRKRLYTQALDALDHISTAGRVEESYLALRGDVYAHTGKMDEAMAIYSEAIARNPDNDQDYLSLALLQLRMAKVSEAKRTLQKGQARVPGSGKLLWGQGLISALQGMNAEAIQQWERAVDLLPEWAGGYSTLGVFYYETGQIEKAREVLSRFRTSSAGNSLDTNRIEQLLAQAPSSSIQADAPMTADKRTQLLQLALALADRSL